MSRSDFSKTEAIFRAAVQMDDATEREHYIRSACQGDSALLQEVESLLAADDRADEFLETPPVACDAILDAPLSEDPGTVIGPYRLLEKIGEGGMAVVYMAEQEQPLRRHVALKIIKLGMDTKEVIARFSAERQVLALMNHPHIAKVHDAGATDTGRPFFVMELVRGVSITEYCDTNKLSTQQRLELFIPVCNAVHHAHQKGIIHRDLKPSNILVTMHDGKPAPMIIDFGISKATNQRLTEHTVFTRYAEMIGTPEYMSPEQAEMSELDIDTRTDIYSLGIVLYELLTGAPPLDAQTLRKAGYIKMQRIICEQPPLVPSTKLSTLGQTLIKVAHARRTNGVSLRKLIRGDLDWIVMKSLDKDRTQRYSTVVEFATDVERHLSGRPVLAGPPTGLYRVKRFVQRRLAWVATAMVVTTAVLGGLVFSTMMYLQTDQALKRETTVRAELLAVRDFFTKDLLAAVYPEKIGGQQVPLRHLLDTASTNLQHKLRKSPLSEAAIRQELGLIFQKMGDYRVAETHLERALEIRRTQLGEQNPAALTSMNSLGWLYWNEGRYEQCAPLLAEAFETRQDVLGPEHPDTLQSMTHLAWLDACDMEGLKRIVSAKQAYQTVCRVLGKDHPVALDATGCLTMKYLAEIKHEEAEALAPKRAYEISRQALGKEHRTTLVLMNALAHLYDRRHQFDAGMKIAKPAFEIAQRVFGNAHVVSIHAAANLGSLYIRQGRYEEASSLLSRTLALSRQHLGESHLITICCTLRICSLYHWQENYEEHDTVLIELLKTIRRRYGEHHDFAGLAKYRLSTRHAQLVKAIKEHSESGNKEEAAAAVKRLEEIRRVLEDHTDESIKSSD